MKYNTVKEINKKLEEKFTAINKRFKDRSQTRHIERLAKSEDPIEMLLCAAIRAEEKKWLDPKNSKKNWDERARLIKKARKVK